MNQNEHEPQPTNVREIKGVHCYIDGKEVKFYPKKKFKGVLDAKMEIFTGTIEEEGDEDDTNRNDL